MPAILGDDERKALYSLLKGAPLELGATWLKSVHINNHSNTGWAHQAGHPDPTEWGGTLDGIRGLLAVGVKSTDPMIKRSVEWLFSKQRPDGGWGSREIVYSAVEPTAWVLITLKEVDPGIVADARFQKAVSFLETAILPDGSLATSIQDKHEPRVLPSVLALWALHGLSQRERDISRYIKEIRDVETGAWGTHKDAKPNVVSTAMALLVLLRTKNLPKNDSITHQVVSYLLKNQEPDGHWKNCVETWFSKDQVAHLAVQVPIRCESYSTNWVVPALLEAGGDITQSAIAKAVAWLVREQSPQGYWLHEPQDSQAHVWCSANCLVALAMSRNAILSSDSALQMIVSRAELPVHESRLAGLSGRIRGNVTNIAVVMLALLVLWEHIRSLAEQVASFFVAQVSTITLNLVSSAIFLALVAIGSWFLAKLQIRKP
jgi:prenyltransferase beta subunit